ncbi:MAG TPA: tetratricopeptide repeat protein, partial [Ignavibacteria bacterium]|nr:tetratricopeptide repeat protein [Ignavibacteria bacterium]HMR41984.1 tetratricopeptide repeat protein [Ignavibacteria bacterium]
LTEAIESYNGFIFEIIGDSFCAAFEIAADAVKAAIDAQIKLAKENWTDAAIKVRIGIHSGKAEWNGNNYMGYITLARTARVMSAAYGEQILISNDTYVLISKSLALPPSHEDTKTAIKDLVSLCLSDDYTVCFRDLGERRLKDVIKPINLFQVTAPGLREDFPPLKTLDARPNNLPVQLSSFIGREKELKQVKEILSDTHLLTLTGTGGTGKSRLALQTGADVIDNFVNGVWFVELAPLSEPMLLIQTVMSAIRILENPKESPEVTLTGYLKDKEILIILDNCEHMVDICSDLAEKLLSLCPKLKILATSREALKCSGETIYRIPSLSCPELNCKETPEQLTQYESVRLFIERAIVLNQNFRVTNKNAPALAEICSRLDGIPLAIELAAARTKILSIEKIYERLDDIFRLLTGGKRTALPRQQTLKSLIDWSYDLLTEDEKILWSRLSVFRGGWTIEAAEDICSDELPDECEVIELMQNLSEKSIIIFDNTNDRYRMLETIRQYGDEKLRSSEEYNYISKRHSDYFIELAENAELKLQGPEIVEWLKILDEEKRNLEMGLTFSGEKGDADAEARLALALGYYWELRGQFTEGLLRFQKIHSKIKETMDPKINNIIYQIGKFEFHKGEIEKAWKFFCESNDKYIKANDKQGIAFVLNSLGHILNVKGDYEKAIDYFRDSLNIRLDIEDKRGIAICLNNLGNVSLRKGEYDKSIDFFEKSMEINREIGNKRGIANCLNNLGNISIDNKNYGKAVVLFEESLAISREIGDKRGIAICLNNLGIISVIKREYDKAVCIYEESLSISREIGDKRGIASCLNNLGIIFMDQGVYEKASVFYEESLAINRDTGDKRGIANCLNNLGITSYEKEEFEKATEYHEESLAIRHEIGDERGISSSLYDLGNVLISVGKFKNAQEYYQESLSRYIVSGNKINIANNLLRLIELHLKFRSDSSLINLLGFVKQYSDSNKIIHGKSEQGIFDESILKMKEKMSFEEFKKSFEEGKSMTLEEAADLIIKFKL